MLVNPLHSSEFGQCWSNLMLVSGTYLTMVRVERIDQLTSPQITVNTTSTYQNHQTPPPPPHPRPSCVRRMGHSTRVLTSPRTTNSQRDITRRLPALRPLGTSRIRPQGGRDAETCSSTDFKPCRTWKIVFLRPRRSELDGTGAETACNAHDIGLVDHLRLSGFEIWPCRAAAPQNHAKTPLYQKNGAILPLKNAFPSES